MKTTIMTSTLMLSVASGCLLMSGCGGSDAAPRVAVEGAVTLDGKPLDGVTIRFVPKQTGQGAATLLVDGQFKLDATAGPTAGEHLIVFSPPTPELPQAIEAMQAGQRDPLNARTVPLKYQTPGQLQATVTETGNEPLHFELSSRSR